MPDITPIQGYGYGQYITSVSGQENSGEIKVSLDAEDTNSMTIPDSFTPTQKTENKAYDSTGKITKNSKNSNQKEKVYNKTDISGKPITPEEEKVINELEKDDRAVHAHEEAHLAAGAGLIRGGVTYSYTIGPDGKQYAVGGEVKIDISPVPNDPEATIRKMEQVKRAALAPADPSPQDRNAASIAASEESKANAELLQEQTQGAKKVANKSQIIDKYTLDNNYKINKGKFIDLVSSIQS